MSLTLLIIVSWLALALLLYSLRGEYRDYDKLSDEEKSERFEKSQW